MTPTGSDYCPRCGDTILLTHLGDICCSGCGVTWPTVKAFEREVIARGLAGTLPKAGAEYVTNGSLDKELQELADLSAKKALLRVRKALDVAIEGRKSLAKVEENVSIVVEYRAGIRALESMAKWLDIEINSISDSKD